jgi:hypothetical protein
MNKLITYTRIAEEQYINLLKQLICQGKLDIDVVSLLQARLNNEAAKKALSDAQTNQGISPKAGEELEVEVCRALIAYYQEVKAIIGLQAPVAGQSFLDYKRESLNLPTAIKGIEDLIRQASRTNSFCDRCNKPTKDKLDKYDQALREAILRDGVPICSLTNWDLRQLQSILGIDDCHAIPPEALRSAVKIDYIPLWRLLEAKQWQEANHLTQQLMVETARRSRLERWITEPMPYPGSLQLADLQNFPCVDLLTIDYLWSRFSHCQFGFSVQNQVWRFLNAHLNEFTQQVGWLTETGWISAHYLQAPPMAKRGHLPFVLPILQSASYHAYPPCHYHPYQHWNQTADCLNELLQRLESCPIRLAS